MLCSMVEVHKHFKRILLAWLTKLKMGALCFFKHFPASCDSGNEPSGSIQHWEDLTGSLISSA
jgi:hypothetical protein